MDFGEQANAEGNAAVAQRQKSGTQEIADRGVNTGEQLASLMSALMSDLISGRITPGVGNAACNAAGKLLKIVEMQYKYGHQNGGTNPSLNLTPENKSK